MHRGHDHGAVPPHGRNDRAAQWQTPHLPEPEQDAPPQTDEAKDLDLVERAFCEGFATASDPTSFLRLAGVPFEGLDAAGRRLALLRVEHQQATHLGSVTPQLGGGGFRYAPLPAKLSSREQRLQFLYFDGEATVALDFEAAKALTPVA